MNTGGLVMCAVDTPANKKEAVAKDEGPLFAP